MKKNIKILHTADWHIGQFEGPVMSNGENARFIDICKCLNDLVNEAKKQEPDAILVAGDIFDNAKVWTDRGLHETNIAIGYLRRLEKIAPVTVLLGTLNHDGKRHFELLQTAFENDSNVNIVTEPKVVPVVNQKTGAALQVACLPGFDKGYFRSQFPGLSREEEAQVFADQLHQIILGLRAQCNEGVSSILMGHYTISGADMGTSMNSIFGQFEPVIYPATLKAANFDLVCFGHIHKSQQIQPAGNVWYSGAISALNFNDEGVKHGFLMHTLGEKFKTEFIPLHSREFATVSLMDTDIAEFNKNPMPYHDEALETLVKDKQVRVVYDCTEEHHKAFSHSMYERHLYANGAYYVQSIYPQKIVTTVDKEAMDKDTSPEKLLVDYLENKSFREDKIHEITELAKPVINEVMERVTKNHNTGVMMPISIEVKNYRHYSHEVFSFEDITFCVINGENGVGKSSLFMDSIMDCLFEQTREGDLTGWINNNPEVKSGSIAFTFSIGKHIYRVCRTRTKSGKGTLNLSENVNGRWIDLSSEKMRDTQAAIEKVIEMDAVTLKACALIMQQQYGVFMEASPETRMNILANMLGLKPYEQMADQFSQLCTETNRKVRVSQDILDEKCEKLGGYEASCLEENLKKTEEQISRYRAALKEENEKIDECRNLLKQKEVAAQSAERLQEKLRSKKTSISLKNALYGALRQRIEEADNLIAQEPEIHAGVAQYNSLKAKSDSMIVAKATFDSLTEQISFAETQKNLCSGKHSRLEAELADVTEKMQKIESVLQNVDEAEAKHNAFLQLEAKIAEMNNAFSNYAAVKERMLNCKAEMEKTIKDGESEVARQMAVIDRLQDKTALLKNSNCPIAESAKCTFLADALKAQEEIPAALKRLEKIKDEAVKKNAGATEMYEAIVKALSDIPYDADEADRLAAMKRDYAESEKMYSQMQELKRQKDSLVEKMSDLKKRLDEIAAEEESILAKIANLNQEKETSGFSADAYTSLQNDLKAAEIWVQKEKDLTLEKALRDTNAAREKEVKAEITEMEEDYNEMQKDLDIQISLSEGKKELQEKLNALNEKAEEISGSISSLTEGLGILKRKQEERDMLVEEIKTLKDKVESDACIAARYDLLKQAFSQDGIPHNIIRSVLPILEAKATDILAQMSSGKMSVEFVTEKVLKSNNKKEVTTLDVIINDERKGKLPYLSKSGGEKVKCSLAVILALAELKKSRMGVQTGFLFIDEAAFLDSTGVQAYCDSLVAIQGRYPDLKIMAITHDLSFKARFPQSIDIIDTDEGSRIMR